MMIINIPMIFYSKIITSSGSVEDNDEQLNDM